MPSTPIIIIIIISLLHFLTIIFLLLVTTQAQIPNEPIIGAAVFTYFQPLTSTSNNDSNNNNDQVQNGNDDDIIANRNAQIYAQIKSLVTNCLKITAIEEQDLLTGLVVIKGPLYQSSHGFKCEEIDTWKNTLRLANDGNNNNNNNNNNSADQWSFLSLHYQSNIPKGCPNQFTTVTSGTDYCSGTFVGCRAIYCIESADSMGFGLTASFSLMVIALWAQSMCY